MTARVVPIRVKPEVGELGDAALARACAEGDSAAIAMLFDRFREPVRRYVRRLAFAEEDVDDLVQTTFMQVAARKALYDGRASVKTWLFAIATNVVRHHRRSWARRSRLLGAIRQVPREAGRADERAEARSELAQVRRAMERLSDARREAFILCELEGLSAREAADVLGTSEAAVWKRVSKARAQVWKEVRG